MRDGVGWHRMAVVVRQGALVESVARQLAIHEVPTRTLVSDQALRDQPLVREFITALRLSEPGRLISTSEAETFLSGEIGGLSAVDARRLRLALRHRLPVVVQESHTHRLRRVHQSREKRRLVDTRDVDHLRRPGMR